METKFKREFRVIKEDQYQCGVIWVNKDGICLSWLGGEKTIKEIKTMIKEKKEEIKNDKKFIKTLEDCIEKYNLEFN